jgi:hypothetical protein
MNLATILDDCLQRLQAGETLAGCLARYPDQAADLAPMLVAAAQLASLAGRQPADVQRQRTLARLRQEAASQRAGVRTPARAGRLAPIFAVRRLAVMAAVALLLLVTLSAGVVASSQPGQPAYELRVLVERAPLLVTFDASARAAAELKIADRRLADLRSHLARARQVEPAALRAMLAGDRAAARQALAAGEAERRQAIRRLTRRAELLAELAGAAHNPVAAEALTAASRSTWRLVDRLRASLTEPETPGQPAIDATATATPTWTTTPSLSATATAAASQMPSATASPTPSLAAPDAPAAATATPTASPAPALAAPTQGTPPTPRPRPILTMAAQTATALAQTPAAQQTPRPRLTAIAQTATALAQTPPAQQTPRPRLTAIALTATALAQTPPAQQTPRPRLTATAQAQTATAQAQATASPPADGTPTPGQPAPTETVPAEPTAEPPPSGPRPPQWLPRPGRP